MKITVLELTEFLELQTLKKVNQSDKTFDDLFKVKCNNFYLTISYFFLSSYYFPCYFISFQSFPKFQEQMQVNLQLRISPQHHDIVKGKNNTHLLKIMEHTNTKVC